MTERTGVQIAMDLAEFGARMVAAKYRREHPGASEPEIAEAVRDWWSQRPGAPAGDAPGIVRSLEQSLFTLPTGPDNA